MISFMNVEVNILLLSHVQKDKERERQRVHKKFQIIPSLYELYVHSEDCSAISQRVEEKKNNTKYENGNYH